jgi:hypothetical protein
MEIEALKTPQNATLEIIPLFFLFFFLPLLFPIMVHCLAALVLPTAP